MAKACPSSSSSSKIIYYLFTENWTLIFSRLGFLFGPRNFFWREGSPQNSSPSGSEIRRASQLIRHLIGDVWAQYRGMGRMCKRTLRARTRVRMGFKANYEISHGHWQRPPRVRAPACVTCVTSSGRSLLEEGVRIHVRKRTTEDLAFDAMPSIGDAIPRVCASNINVLMTKYYDAWHIKYAFARVSSHSRTWLSMYLQIYWDI